MEFPDGNAGQAMMDFVAIVHKVVEYPRGRYRAEDLLSAAASCAGEVILRQSAPFDVDGHAFNPGAPIFSQKATELLSGDRSAWNEVPITSAFGSLFHILTKKPESPWPASCFPEVAGIYQRFAMSRRNGVSKEAWGKAPLSVATMHYPVKPPLRTAFEIRQLIVAHWRHDKPSLDVVRVLTTTALCRLLITLQNVIAHDVAITIVLETMNAMAKTAPVLQTHIDSWDKASA